MEWIKNTENNNILMVQHILDSKESDEKEYKYFTIYEKDKTEFLQLFQPMDFLSPWKFRIIEDKEELKNIIKNSFLSKNRGEEYDETYTSVSRIANDLFPMSINEKGLIFWMKSQTLESYNEQQEKNKEAQDFGTTLHLLLEKISLDNRHLSIKEKEIKNYVKNIDELYYEAVTEYKQYKFKNSINYIRDILQYTDPICSELFLKSKNNNYQGTADSLCYFKDKLFLRDYKTTSKIDKKTGKGLFKSPGDLKSYKRQLFLYHELMVENNIIQKGQIEFALDMFSFPRKEYRVYDFDKEDILNNEKEVYNVIEWFNNNK